MKSCFWIYVTHKNVVKFIKFDNKIVIIFKKLKNAHFFFFIIVLHKLKVFVWRLHEWVIKIEKSVTWRVEGNLEKLFVAKCLLFKCWFFVIHMVISFEFLFFANFERIDRNFESSIKSCALTVCCFMFFFLPRSGTASEVLVIWLATNRENTVWDSRIVTSENEICSSKTHNFIFPREM